MNRTRVWTATCLTLGMAATACSQTPVVRDAAQEVRDASVTEVDRTLAQASPRLPDHARWAYLEEFSRTLDMTASGTELRVKPSGTSVYTELIRNGKSLGAVIPENAATKLSGEVMAFSLARALGIADLYQPGVYHFLTGKNLRAFREAIPDAPFKSRLKEENRKAIIARIISNPNGIDAIYKDWGSKPADYDALVSVKANTLNTTHVLPGGSSAVATLLTCKGPQPSRSKTVTVNRGTSSEYEMIRQLSSIFLIDALTQQWDRFSGGNLQTVTENGAVKFVAFDNGGTWGGPKWTSRYLERVTRFDRNVAQGILEMDRFFSSGGEYLGLRNEEEFIQAMGISNIRKQMPAFKQSLKTVAEHIRRNKDCFFL